MEQHKLLTLNGEYVKLYVTTNSSLPRLLKNSGSLIVYHDLYYDKYTGYLNKSFSYKDDIISNSNIKNLPTNSLFSKLFKNYILSVVDRVNDHVSNPEEYHTSRPMTSIDTEDEEVPIIQYTRFNNLYLNEGNYLYLGNELIAGGWGFDNETQKKLAIQHLTIIPQYLEQFGQILNNEIEFRGNEDEDIRYQFKRYILKNSDLGSQDEDGILGNNTWLNSNYFPGISNDGTDKPIYLRDLPYILEKAQYEGIKIHTIKQTCKVSFLNVKNNHDEGDYNIYSNYYIPSENETNKEYLYKDELNNILYVPIGSSLSTYEIDIQYDKNDSGGLIGAQYKQLLNKDDFEDVAAKEIIYSNNVIQLNSDNEEEQNSSITISLINDEFINNDIETTREEVLNRLYQDAIESTSINYDNIFSQNVNNYKFKKYWPIKTSDEDPSGTESTNGLDVSNFVRFNLYNEIYYPFKDYKIIVGETLSQNLKNYPIVDLQISRNGVDNVNTSLKYLKSVENKIKEHTIDIDTIKIIPKYLLYGMTPKQIPLSEINQNSFKIDFLNGEKTNQNMDLVDISKLIISNNISIKTTLRNVNSEEPYYFLSFAIPSIYDINRIVIRKDNNWERDITGNFMILPNCKLSLNPINANPGQRENYSVVYSIYKYNGPKTNDNIEVSFEFDLYENPSMVSSSSNLISDNDIFKYVNFNNAEILDTDSFNGSHWLDYDVNNSLLKYVKKYLMAYGHQGITLDNNFNSYKNMYLNKFSRIFS